MNGLYNAGDGVENAAKACAGSCTCDGAENDAADHGADEVEEKKTLPACFPGARPGLDDQAACYHEEMGLPRDRFRGTPRALRGRVQTLRVLYGMSRLKRTQDKTPAHLVYRPVG